MIYYSPATLGFYDSEVHSVDHIPSDAIPVSEEDYQALMQAQSQRKIISLNSEGYPVAVDPPGFTIEELIAQAMMRINRAYEIAVNAMTSGYPQEEIDSWPEQKIEAQAFLTGSSNPTLWLDAASTARGITKTEFANKIMENANAFAVLHGQLTGKRQKLRDQILELGPSPTQEQLEAIQW